MRLRLDPADSPARQQALQLSVRPGIDGCWVVALAGELDAFAVPGVREAIDAAFARADRCVHVDLGALTYIDSAGIRELLYGQARAAREGREFGVVDPLPPIRRLFEIADVAGLILDDVPCRSTG